MRGAARRRIGSALAALGVAVLAWAALAVARVEWTAREQTALLMQQRTRGPAATTVSRPRRGDVVALLEVPRLGLSSVVLEGDDEDTLARAAGHLPDTPLPGSAGNAAVAAHRDTVFRPLRGIRVGDVIRVMTRDADYEYVVRETRVVRPVDVWVLDPTTRATLTLITCYPFTYVGPAPERFVVRAERQEITQRS